MGPDNLSSAAMATTPIAPGLRRLPFTIRLSPQFVNRLLSRSVRMDASNADIQGLLFGISDESLLLVQAFRSFPEVSGESLPERERLEQLLATVRKDPEISPLELVGWYTSRMHGGLLQSDIQFHDSHFKKPNDLAMVLKPEGSSDVLMELYCRSVNGLLSNEGHRWGAVRLAKSATLVGPVEIAMRAKIQDDFFMRAYESADPEKEETQGLSWKQILPSAKKKALNLFHTERRTKPQNPAVPQPFPLDRTADARKEPVFNAIVPKPTEMPTSREGERTGTRSRVLQKISAGAPPSVPAVIPDVPRRYAIPWASSALVFAVAAGLTFGLVYSRGLGSGDSTPGFLRGWFPAPGLGLRLENQGDRVLLSWNRHHPAVSSAKSGVLQIDDGTQRRRVTLDAAQVANGSVLYRPNSDDVTFRLEVEGMQGGRVTESTRLLESPKAGTLDVSVPAPNQPLPQQPATNPVVAPTQRSTAIISSKNNRNDSVRPSANAQETPRAQAPVQNNQPTPPPYQPAELPAKKADNQGDVAYDVLPPIAPPTQAPKNEESSPASNSAVPSKLAQPESPQSTVPAPVTNTAPPVEKQNTLTPSAAPPQTQARPASPVPSQTQIRSTPAVAYRAPRPRKQVLPNVTQLAPNVLATAGRVEVIVNVNERGQVVEAHLAAGSRKISATLAGASLLAARQWAFEPATLGGKPVPSEHSIVFQFQSSK